MIRLIVNVLRWLHSGLMRSGVFQIIMQVFIQVFLKYIQAEMGLIRMKSIQVKIGKVLKSSETPYGWCT